MSSSEDPFSQSQNEKEPFVEIRYSLPALLREVKRDRASTAFAMEKLDQAAINTLFEQHLARRESGSNKQ
jgi:hypothetical protein